MTKVIIFFLPILIISCATTMPGYETATGHKHITATVETNPTFTNDQIQMYQFSLKNETDNWIEFDGATIEGSTDVNFLVGNRISSWVEACTLEQKVSDYNTSMVLGAIAVTGAAISAGSQHQQTSQLGSAFALGSISAIGVREFQNAKSKIEFQNAFPRTHIFQPFSLPPRKVIQRWILIENPNKKEFKLKLKAKSGEEITLQIEANSSSGPIQAPKKTRPTP